MKEYSLKLTQQSKYAHTMVVDYGVYKGCPISFPNKVTLVYLIEIDMLDFDVILGMDWLHAYFTSIYCRTRVVKFQFPN